MFLMKELKSGIQVIDLAQLAQFNSINNDKDGIQMELKPFLMICAYRAKHYCVGGSVMETLTKGVNMGGY
jgi:hypothetical protein